MREYALIFRPMRSVAAADQPLRDVAARNWALALRSRGILRGASPLDDEGGVVTERGVEAVPISGATAAILIVAADSLEEVLTLAQGHPGLVYGTAIEVRPVKAAVAAR